MVGRAHLNNVTCNLAIQAKELHSLNTILMLRRSRIVKAGKRRIQRFFPGLKKPPKIDPDCPFGNAPRADRATYLKLHEEACARKYPEIDSCLERFNFPLDRDWLQNLALHTQVVIKYSPLNFQHGYLLYALVRKRLENANPGENLTILETGTARGFSAICMARAILDAGRTGRVITVDLIPHNKSIYWNCIDDNDGKKTRQELLHPWQEELESIIFLQGETRAKLNQLGLSRIHFAFLDACHTEEEVLSEFRYVAARQNPGDLIFFDDVTEGLFDGVVAAAKKIQRGGEYSVEYIVSAENRGYAIAARS